MTDIRKFEDLSPEEQAAIGREAVRRLNEVCCANVWQWPALRPDSAVKALCQLLTETGFKEPEPRDLVMARRIGAAWAVFLGLEVSADIITSGGSDQSASIQKTRAILREYAGEEA